MKKIVMLSLILFIGITSFSKMITFRGVYQGKNVYVHNPYDEQLNQYCVTYVYVNGEKVVSNPHTSAFEIPFDTISIGTKLNIQVYGHQECIQSIRLLNPAAIKSDAKFSFVSFRLSESKLYWRAKGESPKGSYLVEYFLNKEWVVLEQLEAKHNVSEDNYIVDVKTFPGENRFKLIFVEGDGTRMESNDQIIMVKGAPVKFFPLKVDNEISFFPNIKVNYEIVNIQGETVKKGKGSVIDCTELEKKQYYTIYYNNQKGRFYKKR